MSEKISRRQLLKVMGVTTLGVGLAGCVAPAAPGAAPSAGGDSQPAAAAQQLAWWTAPLYPGGVDGKDKDAEADVFPKWLVEQYKANHPNVEVAIEVIPFADQGVQKVVAAKAAGTQPNVVYMDTSFDQYANGWFIAIDDYITDEDRADVYDWAWNMQMYGGKVYGWPWFIDPFPWTIVNKKIFEEAKATDLLPSDPDRAWNWDQYLEALKATTFKRADGTQVYGTGLTGVEGGYFYWSMLENFGAQIWDADGKWTVDSEAGVKGLQYLLDLQEVHQVLAPGVAGIKLDPLMGDYFMTGNMGLINWFGGQNGTIRNGLADGSITVPMESYVCRPPSLPDVKTTMFTASKTHYPMMPGAQDQALIDTTVDFAKFLVNKENARAIARIGPRSVRRSGGDWFADANDPNETFMDQAIGAMTIKLFAAPTAGYNWSVMHQEWLTTVQAVFNKEKTPQQALQDVTKKLNALAGF